MFVLQEIRSYIYEQMKDTIIFNFVRCNNIYMIYQNDGVIKNLHFVYYYCLILYNVTYYIYLIQRKDPKIGGVTCFRFGRKTEKTCFAMIGIVC